MSGLIKLINRFGFQFAKNTDGLYLLQIDFSRGVIRK